MLMPLTQKPRYLQRFNTENAAKLEESITRLASLGLGMQFTKVDVSVYRKQHKRSTEPFKGKAEFTPEIADKQA